jgi:hypothetical protein
MKVINQPAIPLQKDRYMRSIHFFATALLAIALLQGCSDKNEATPSSETGKVTQTRMNDIDSLEGTISDEMIITDDATDEAALEGDGGSSDAKESAKESGVSSDTAESKSDADASE